MDYSVNYISMAEKTDPQYHRAPIILHNGQWYLAEFQTKDQLDFFAQTLGFTYTKRKENDGIFGHYEEYDLSHRFDDTGSFYHTYELPQDAKPIKALSNGGIVTCYFTNDGQTIKFYRPNPNSSDSYSPLSIEDHITHVRIYGLY